MSEKAVRRTNSVSTAIRSEDGSDGDGGWELEGEEATVNNNNGEMFAKFVSRIAALETKNSEQEVTIDKLKLLVFHASTLETQLLKEMKETTADLRIRMAALETENKLHEKQYGIFTFIFFLNLLLLKKNSL
jgi:uncharacterized coiled-coil protein SlyX